MRDYIKTGFPILDDVLGGGVREGLVILRCEGKAVWWTNDQPPATNAGRHAWTEWLHRRNETMVRRTAMLGERYDVRLAGLFSSTPGTSGTGMTVDCARAAGIPCDVEVF